MTLIYFIIILGITVMLHETGHFIFAKKSGVYVYEFSIGMGPRLFKWTRPNDETEYSIRLLPIGGFVSLSGEEGEDDKNVPKGMCIKDKTFLQNLFTMAAGVMFNFLLAIILLFIVGIFNGYISPKAVINSVEDDSPAFVAGLKSGDVITKVNNHSVNNTDKLLLELAIVDNPNINIVVSRDSKLIDITIDAKEVSENGNTSYVCGFTVGGDTQYGFIPAIKYAFTKFGSLMEQMLFIVVYLFSGKLSINNLSGPVGIYVLIGKTAQAGILSLVYLMAYISLNVGFVNFLPFPAFDGGRVLFLIIEKITGKKINPKVENIINSIGFVLLMLLMIYVTYHDLYNLFK